MSFGEPLRVLIYYTAKTYCTVAMLKAKERAIGQGCYKAALLDGGTLLIQSSAALLIKMRLATIANETFQS